MPSELYERFSEHLKPKGGRRTREHRSRSAVAKDRDRIIHSGAFRRLQRKSQIVGVQSNDFFRTRLTHTLECAQIGRAIAARSLRGPLNVVEDPADLPDLIEAACLAHDLGHPPFGHNGEQALQGRMREHSRSLFEGNAQSFRIVTNLEPKARVGGRSCGLDLTRTTLKAILKYPHGEEGLLDHPHPKFCIYDNAEDDEVFRWLFADETPARTIATEILEAADDIAYAVHDFEDGVWSGMIPLFRLIQRDDNARGRLYESVSAEHPDLFADVKFGQELQTLLRPISRHAWAQVPFERARRPRAALKKFCAELIGGFIEEVTPRDRFRKPTPTVARRLHLLHGMARVWMIDAADQETLRFGQRRLVDELFEGYWANPQMLPQRERWEEIRRAGPTPIDRQMSAAARADEPLRVWRDKARLICDHVAGMTDLYALHVHAEMYQGGAAPQLRMLGA
jgi:dGTPase